jgi:hypothetical protein
VKVGAVDASVEAGDSGEPDVLLGAEVLGRLEQRPPRALEHGRLGGALALARLGAPHVVDGLVRELHDVERVEGDLGLGSAPLARLVLGPGDRLGHDAVIGADEPAQHRADDDAPLAEREVPPLARGLVVPRAARERAARAAVSPVPLRHVHHDPGRAESDASHERTLQSEQLVEYRGDVHWLLVASGPRQTTKYHGFPVRFLLPLAEPVTLLASRYVRLLTD